MSQKKVDLYKEQKANRKQIMKRQKRMKALRYTLLGVVAAALVGWLGYSAYGSYEGSQPRAVAEVNFDAINDYLDTL